MPSAASDLTSISVSRKARDDVNALAARLSGILGYRVTVDRAVRIAADIAMTAPNDRIRTAVTRIDSIKEEN